LHRFIDAHLKSGGLAYLSYNAMPGWTGDLPFQHLVRELAGVVAGDSAARFARAAGIARRLADTGARRLADSYIVGELRARPQEYQPGYLVHEFMHAGWQALYVTEVRRDLAEIGLAPVGSATLVENFDRWMFSRSARQLLAEIGDADHRELARDFLIDQRLRCDVFTRDAASLGAAEQRRLLTSAGLALARPPGAIAYRAATPGGRLDYDNRAARTIVGALASGARSLADIAEECVEPRDLVANALALCAGGDVRPAETTRTPVEPLNRVLRRRFGGPEEIPVLALPCGTALDLDGELLGFLRGGDRLGERAAVWREFLALHQV